jgi:hypothetical protein
MTYISVPYSFYSPSPVSVTFNSHAQTQWRLLKLVLSQPTLIISSSIMF